MASKIRSRELSEPIQLQEDNLEPLEEQDVDDEGDSELFEDENEAMVEELLNDVKNVDELKSGSFVYVGVVDKACSNPSKANTKHYEADPVCRRGRISDYLYAAKRIILCLA